MLPESALSRYRLAGHRSPTQIPDEVFNLFIQYKRSDSMIGTGATHYRRFKGHYYRFRFDTPANQLPTLHALALSSGSDAHVVYAAPEFHTMKELFEATRTQQVITKSVIVEARHLLTKHKAFNFRSGFTSIQNPEPENVKSTPAQDWFDSLEAPVASLASTMTTAVKAVRSTPRWDRLWSRNQSELLGAEPFAENVGSNRLVRQFAEVTAFTWLHGLSWTLSGYAPAQTVEND